ncbi:MAG: hypothetical protein AAFR67_02965 [Chloroflexota bacterium]
MGGVFDDDAIDDAIHPTQRDHEVACLEVFSVYPAFGGIELVPWRGFDFFTIDSHIGELVVFMRDGICDGVFTR